VKELDDVETAIDTTGVVMPDFNTVRQLRSEGHSLKAIAEIANVPQGKLHGWYASQFAANAGGKSRQFQMALEPKTVESAVVPQPLTETKGTLKRKFVLSMVKHGELRKLFDGGAKPGVAARNLGIPPRCAWGHYMVWHREQRAKMAEPPPALWTAPPDAQPQIVIPEPVAMAAITTADEGMDRLLPFIRRLWNGYLTEKGRLQPGKHLSNDDVREMLTLFQK
jgi:hypothetical protein